MKKNKFKLLVGSKAFTNSLEKDVGQSKKSIFAQFMTFEADKSGRAFSKLLTQKAKAGLDVRLSVDYYTDLIVNDTPLPLTPNQISEVNQEKAKTKLLFKHLKEKGVKIKRTAPIGLLREFMPYRDHKKIITIDNSITYIGGINISDHNYDWHDFMVRIKGPIVKDIELDYLSTWDGKTVKLGTPKKRGDFVLNQAPGRPSVFNEVLEMIEKAQVSVVIESPYLIGSHIEKAMFNAAKRGVEVKLIIPYQNNRKIFELWIHEQRRLLKHPNITVYGFQKKHNMTHAKLVVVDNKKATFGSSNFSELEVLGQKEINVFTDNHGFIRQAKEFLNDDMDESSILPPPKVTLGRLAYYILYSLLRWRTRKLAKNKKWQAVYS